MPSLERSDIESSLVKKGFVRDDRDHRFFRLVHEGKTTGIFTMTSHGTGYRSLSADLVGKMAKQLKLKTKEFVDLVECPLTADAYIALLIQKDAL